MSTRLPYTPNFRIRQSLRILWMRSRERAAALKATNYCCAYCGIKQSAAKGREVKLDVHHLDPPDWNGIFDEIRRRLLHDPSRLAPACEKCHDNITGKSKEIIGEGK
jgi:5-methylcytosine-specific restriction endonuclease McrA